MELKTHDRQKILKTQKDENRAFQNKKLKVQAQIKPY